MGIKFANNAVSTLAGSLNTSATSLTLFATDGAKFPALSAGDYFMMTLTKQVGGVAQREIVKVTARSGDSCTIVRAQEGTTALTFAAGDIADNRITAGTADLFAKNGENIAAAALSVSGQSTMQDQLLVGPILKDASAAYFDSTTVNTLDYTAGAHQRWSPGTGAQTLAITNWPSSGQHGDILIEGVNLGAATITSPSIKWVKSDGTFATTTAFNTNHGATLQASGIDFILLWTRDGGTTIYGKVVR